MSLIDRYAYTSRIRSIEPAQKAGLAALVILICLILPRPAVGCVAVLWMGTLTVWWGGIPFPVVGRVLLAEGLFLLLAVVGVVLSFSWEPPPASFWGIQIGPLWISTGQGALALAGLLVSRALGAVAAMNFLALTTPFTDLVALLRRLRVSPILIDLMDVMYRFVFVLLDSVERIYTAQQSRLGYVTRYTALRSSGLLVSRLFLDAYQRSQRMQTALESRGYSGHLRVLPRVCRHDGQAYLWTVAVGVSLLFAGLCV